MQQQGEGHSGQARPMTEADRRWLEDALKSAMIDLGKRMKDIKDTLDAGEAGSGAADGGSGASLEEREQLLDELMDIVESIDLARGGAAGACHQADSICQHGRGMLAECSRWG